MEPTAYEAWLCGIPALTEPQRRRAWQALALCEAAESLLRNRCWRGVGVMEMVLRRWEVCAKGWKAASGGLPFPFVPAFPDLLGTLDRVRV